MSDKTTDHHQVLDWQLEIIPTSIEYTCITKKNMISDYLPGNKMEILIYNNKNQNQDKQTINYLAFSSFDFDNIR